MQRNSTITETGKPPTEEGRFEFSGGERNQLHAHHRGAVCKSFVIFLVFAAFLGTFINIVCPNSENCIFQPTPRSVSTHEPTPPPVSIHEPSPPSISIHEPRLLRFGTDISEIYGIEDGGLFFTRQDGSVAPALDIIHENGYEWARIRIMVDPDGKFGLFQDLSYVLRMARDAKQKNMRFLLDFHYSHFWADGDNQWTPDRWRENANGKVLPFLTLKRSVFDYTKRVMQVLNDNDAYPDAVQVGNEIRLGMLWPHGKIPSDWDEDKVLPDTWLNLAALLQAGIDAIEEVSTSNDVARPKIAIHLDTGGNKALTEKWMKTYFSLKGSCDIIALSWYPMWHGTMTDLKDNLDNLEQKFPDQEVWVVETAYYYEGYCEAEDVACKKKFPYPMTEQGQFDFLTTLRETLETTACRAVFYWGSNWSQPNPSWFRSSEDWDDTARRALFNRQGRALAGICALPGTCTKSLETDRNQTIPTVEGTD